MPLNVSGTGGRPDGEATGQRLRRCVRRDDANVALIAIVAWVANYLHFTRFGLHEDDWFFMGFPFVVGCRTWLRSSLVDMLIRLKGQGRPLQNVFMYLFSAIGAWFNSLDVDYVLAYSLFTLSAIL